MASNRITSRHQTTPGAYTRVQDLTGLRHAARQIDLIAISRVLNPLSGLLTSNIRGRGMNFSEVRAYQPGDDVRSIDWRVTARTEKPHTKLYEEEKERPILLVIDQTQSMFFGSRVSFKSVVAAQSAALIAWTALDGGDRVGGILFGDAQQQEVRPRRSKHALLKLLREIHRYNHSLGSERAATNPASLTQALASTRRVCKHGAAIFVISDFQKFDSEAEMHLSHLARHNDLVGIHISDPLERQLPEPNLYTITDGAMRARINTADEGYRSAYRTRFDGHLAALQRAFGKLGSPLFELRTDEPVVDSLASKYSNYARSTRRARRAN